jgi:lauroyl/myristoyl acyltransferase
MKPSAEDLAAALRRRVPFSALPLLVEARFRLAWSRASVRADARAQMQFLLEHTRPHADLEAVARAYVKAQIWRGELRWHPSAITHMRVEGLEHLQAARELGAGVVLNFTHHGQYEGAFSSLARNGFPLRMVVYPYMLAENAPRWLQQHMKVACTGGGVAVSAGIGTDGLVDLLRSGHAVAIASDVPGRTPVRFVGREVLGSFGAARLAASTGAPVVVMTVDEDAQGPLVRLHEPLLADRFDGPAPMLEKMLAHHEAALLRRPEWADLPLSRWGLTAPEQAKTADDRHAGSSPGSRAGWPARSAAITPAKAKSRPRSRTTTPPGVKHDA